ncbi:alkaline phytoceramidase [Bradyrhizobium sp. UFLA03-84]|uniref:alkaline phytoceramidase n=1 Tax=Bradyrhizobium sp. UFLA03-84 TaxID=418599 RepID=UPI000BAE3A3C|nr:alkaline phytoceramidase [Bradyrhizobium sp. UFLA03-84]PAY06398.1 alkaline phytoceramidase [Bradyrhizobium sp. UFLA03-84]
MQTTFRIDGLTGSARPVKPWMKAAPAIATIGIIAAFALHGRIAQPAHYNDFADHSALLGIPHAGDVLSNAGFALVAIWGWLALRPHRKSDQLRAGWPGYRQFLIGLLLTAFGSAYFHLAPGNGRLTWDMLPIALAGAGLLVGVRGDTHPRSRANLEAIALALFATAGVAWWVYTDRHGAGDLRPYLLLQVLPLVLIPLWQSIHRAPRSERIAFAAAMGLYVLAKIAEVLDHPIADALGVVSGHTLKHLIATAATAAIVWGVTRRFAGGGRRTAGTRTISE